MEDRPARRPPGHWRQAPLLAGALQARYFGHSLMSHQVMFHSLTCLNVLFLLAGGAPEKGLARGTKEPCEEELSENGVYFARCVWTYDGKACTLLDPGSHLRMCFWLTRRVTRALDLIPRHILDMFAISFLESGTTCHITIWPGCLGVSPSTSDPPTRRPVLRNGPFMTETSVMTSDRVLILSYPKPLWIRLLRCVPFIKINPRQSSLNVPLSCLRVPEPGVVERASRPPLTGST